MPAHVKNKRGWLFALGAVVVVACSGATEHDTSPAQAGAAAVSGAAEIGGGSPASGAAGAGAASVETGGSGGVREAEGVAGDSAGGTTDTSAGASSGGTSDDGAAGESESGSGGLGVSGGASGAAGSGASGGTTSVCVAAEVRCAGRCIDPQTDRRNCGGCGRSCGATYACLDGACACPSEQVECIGGCVDTMTDTMHCGACNRECGSSQVCAAGRCACRAGERLCGSVCIDVTQDRNNCGACGTQCSISQACSAGKCLASSGGELGADGCVGLAGGVTLSSISAYQSVEIPIMRAGAEVAVAARNTDIVNGKDVIARLFVTTTGSSGRVLSGRVLVQNGRAADIYFERKSIWPSSSPSRLDSTFQVRIPAAKVATATRYIAEVVACDGVAAPAANARFSGSAGAGAALGGRAVAPLKVKIIPLRANGLLPDTSANALAVYRSAALAMYPVSSVQLSVGAVLNVADAKDWTGMLDQVRARREAEAPAHDVYYYGMLKPTATIAEYCAVDPSCTTGLGYLVADGAAASQAATRAAVGLAFGDPSSADTMLHELAHNHGRKHAPCGVTETSGIDASFPYSGGNIGVYGWDDRREALIDRYAKDIMSYCSSQWISDYTYDGILTRAAGVNAAASVLALEGSVARWRVLLSDDRGARWGIPFSRPALPHGDAEPALVLDAFGRPLQTVEVYRNAMPDLDGASFLVPEPRSGWASIQVSGARPLAFAP